MDYVFAADVDTAKTDKTSFPDFPGENPPQADMLKWLDAWHDDLVTSGFSAHLRGELPFELAKLKPRELLPVPSDATAAISVDIQNASITHQNEINATEIKERTIELDNRLARKIAKSMRPSGQPPASADGRDGSMGPVCVTHARPLDRQQVFLHGAPPRTPPWTQDFTLSVKVHDH